MVYIANPNNPTGTYLDKIEYSKLVNGIPDHVLLIADEAYYEYARDISDYPPALSHRKDNVIVLRTFSKAFGLAGFRIGYAIAHEALISQMMKTKLTFEPTTTAQAAALAAYKDEEFIQKSVDLVNHERSKLYEFFDKHNIQYVKSISNSVIMIFDSNEEAIDFTQKMLEQGVILRRVNSFGLPNCVRITIGTEQEMSHFKESFKAIR
jgi:histidinol-phosphate aminotransferase